MESTAGTAEVAAAVDGCHPQRGRSIPALDRDFDYAQLGLHGCETGRTRLQFVRAVCLSSTLENATLLVADAQRNCFAAAAGQVGRLVSSKPSD